MPRPSSPLNAKASVRSPYALDRSQQNSCVLVADPVRTRPAHTCALYIQTMMSSRIRPKSSRGSRQNPSIHDVRMPSPACPKRMGPEWKLRCFPRSRGIPLLQGWWSQTGSNRRPHACKARALPTELWPHGALRRAVGDLSQPFAGLVGPGRLELPTLRLSGVRSNHLSYGPMAARQPG